MSKHKPKGQKIIDPIDPKLNTLIFTALGEASVSWSQRPKGVFLSEKAMKIGNKLREEIKDLIRNV